MPVPVQAACAVLVLLVWLLATGLQVTSGEGLQVQQQHSARQSPIMCVPAASR
jgi:hypothetical protein